MRPRRISATRACAALVLALCFAPGHARAQGTDLPEDLRTIAGVRFVGQKALGRREMRAANLHTRAPSWLPWRDRPLLRRDYLRSDSASIVSVYGHYGYLDAHVRVLLEPTKDPRAARVVFLVHEGPRTRISTIELAGVHAYPVADLRRLLLARPGEPYDPAFLQLDTLKIRSAYRERGYFVGVRSHALAGQPDSVHVALRYEVEEGPQYHVGEIQFPPTPNVRAVLGRRELLLKTGDVYGETRLNRSVERLYQTTLYRVVQVTPVPDTTAKTVDLDFLVSERKSRWIDGGIGSGTSDLLRVTNEWGHRNLDTRALSAVVDGELSIYGRQIQHTGLLHRRTAVATLTEPWLLGIRLQGQTALFYREENYRIYKTSDQQVDPLFIGRRVERGFNFSLFREIDRFTRLTLTQENGFITQGFTVTSDTARVIADSLAADVKSRYHSNTLRLSLERDLRNDKISPTRGTYQQVFGELAGGPLHGQNSYRKGQFTSTWYSRLSNGWNFAARLTGGVIHPYGSKADLYSPEVGVDSVVASVPRESRFFIGGVNSLRGYGENAVPPSGGLAMALANVEMRIPLAGPFGIEAFVDAGNVWARPSYLKGSDLILPWQAPRARPGDLRYTYGVGARLVLPFGPLRFDLAWGDRPDFPRARINGFKYPFAFQFAIGPSF